MKKFVKALLIILLVLGIGVGVFCLVGYIYGLTTSQGFTEVMQSWLPFLTKK